ncbi:MAG: putative oxidoreductase iron-sulfur subunit [Firmicutes bacterium]|nr:putative oxidoreductase iron-sulfur subunit [Bacillota bacterium]
MQDTKEVRYGLLIDYDYCTNCHTCEVACKKELNLPVGQYGIRVLEDGPRQTTTGEWEWTYIPLPTSECNLCEDRVKMGKLPTCVHHCQSGIMEFGPVEELAKKMTKATMVLFSK